MSAQITRIYITQISALLVVVLLALACKREIPSLTVLDLRKKLLICDSVQITRNGETTTEVMGKGKGLDMMFTTDLTIYSNPETIYKYTVINSKIYFWRKDQDMHEGDYYLIVFRTQNRVNLLHKDREKDEESLYFYTAE